MGNRKKATKNNKGMTFLEVLIVSTIFSLIIVTITQFFKISHDTWEAYDQDVEILQNARIGMDKMVRELRSQVRSIISVSSPGEEQGYIQFADQNNNPVSFSLQDFNLFYGPPDNPFPLADGIGSLKFVCYKLDGTQTTQTNEIRLIDINMKVFSAEGTANPVTLSSQVFLRSIPAPWPLAFDYIYFAEKGNLKVAMWAYLSGDVYAGGDVLIFSATAEVSNGKVYHGGTLSGRGTYIDGGVPDPLPLAPVLDTSYYDNLITQAFQYPQGYLNYGGTEQINLDGATRYVNGYVVIRDNAVVQGPGRIVATGGIEVRNNAIVKGIQLIAVDEINVINNAKIEELPGSNNIIYSRSYVGVDNWGAAFYASVLCSDQINFKDRVQVFGPVYSLGGIYVSNATNFRGSMVTVGASGEWYVVSGDVRGIYDTDYFPAELPGLW